MTLEELDQDVERFALECLGVPHAELFMQVCDDWQQVERFLDARQRLKDRAHLTLLGGQLTYFLPVCRSTWATTPPRGGTRYWPGSTPRMSSSRCCVHRCGRCRARSRSTPDSMRRRSTCCRLPERTTARTTALGSLPIWRGRTRCWAIGPGQNKPSPPWSATLWTCLPSREIRPIRLRRQCPPWRLRWRASARVGPPKRSRAERSPYITHRASGTHSSRTGQRDTEPGRVARASATAGTGGSSSALHRGDRGPRGPADRNRPQAGNGAVQASRPLEDDPGGQE